MRKITFSFLALLLTAVGAWAQSVTLQPSTSVDSPEFVYYLTNCNQKGMDANTAPTEISGQALGRFAFFAVDGKDDTYTIMSVDATGDNKWLSYDNTNIGVGQNKVSFTSQDNAKPWKLTSNTTKNRTYKSYELHPYNAAGAVVSGQYMNWRGGMIQGQTSVGFHNQDAHTDLGSGWLLTSAPMDGHDYYIFDKTHNMYLSLTKLKNYAGINMVTLTSTPEMCKFTAADGNWKISTTGDNPIYLNGSGSHAVQSTDETTSTAWILQTIYNDEIGEVYCRLKNPVMTGDASFIGNNAHTEEGKEVWANAPSREALDFRLMAGTTKYVNVTVQAGPYSTVMTLPVGNNLDISSYFEANNLLNYTNTVVNVEDRENQTVTVDCTENIPFATSFEGLNTGNKWVSFFTLQGRMHVYDPACYYEGKYKYPSIDRATFAKLNNRKFWGFVCANPLTDKVKIVNKGAGKDAGTLYLTTQNDRNNPLLLAAAQGSYITDEWIIENGQTKQENGQTVQYYTIKANGTSQYINNFQGAGFMTTWSDGKGDGGSNIKFTSELDTYNLLKDRALNAPYNAVHSLTAEARALITGETVADYKQAIGRIKELPAEGVVQFDESKYYYLRNYTPAGQSTYVLDTKNGTTATTIAATYGLGSANDEMTYFNANALWTIKAADPEDKGYTGGSEDIGVSKTIGRKVTHVNSGKKLLAENRNELSSIAMNETGTTFYFVNLGAGQHFIKNEQYNGTGQQAKAMPISCDNSGNLSRRGDGGAHTKNSRDTWYGIPVTSLNITLHNGGDEKYYATAHFPFAVSIDAEETVKAYTVEGIDKENGMLNLAEATGVIPAGTAMILIDENETAKLNILPEVTETAQADAILKGVNMAQAFNTDITADNVLVLGIGGTSSKVGFYLPATGSTGLRSNSAYIPVSELDGVSAANGLKFNFGGVANGIDGVKADSNKGTVVYDLQGRRVNKLSKGLYIVNGKKVIL